MLRTNGVKAKIRRGEIAVGALLLMNDPTLAEVLGLCGFDYLVFDGEHGSLSPELLTHLVRACDAVGVTSIARVRVDTAEALLPYVETGVLGIMQPHTRNAADAEWLVAGSKYAPIGQRGMGTGRSSAYNMIHGAQHAREWNEEMLTIAQIEDTASIDKLDEILAVPGLDACYIGANDLAASLGVTGDDRHPAVREAHAQVARRVRAAGKWAGFGARAPYDNEEAERMATIGADLFSYAMVPFITHRSRELLAATRPVLAAVRSRMSNSRT